MIFIGFFFTPASGGPLGSKPTKYLGTIAQDDGEWREHVTQLTSKGNKTLGFMRRNMKIENKKAKEQAYMMLVRQPLEYASTIWDPHHLTTIKKLENIQRRAARSRIHSWEQI